MFRLSKSEKKTLTEVAQRELRPAITRGTFRPQEYPPTEAELCKILGISRRRVLEASNVLVGEQ